MALEPLDLSEARRTAAPPKGEKNVPLFGGFNVVYERICFRNYYSLRFKI
jgi:hypothetical protein